MVIIGKPENKTSSFTNGFSQSNGFQYEYPIQDLTELTGNACSWFNVPSSVILDTDMDSRRIAAFTFFAVRRGLDNQLSFSINNIVKWSGMTPDRHKGAVNDKYLTLVNQLCDRGYLTYSGNLSVTSYVDGVYNREKIFDECSKYRFAVLYLDEIITILQYQNIKKYNAYFNNAILLLVFAYLRMKIPRRSNRFRLDEDINVRRSNYPEAYDCFLKDIEKDLKIPKKSLSSAVDLLKEMGLIYSEELPRIQYKNKLSEENKWRTVTRIFCNTYKREDKKLLAYGKKYYEPEIERKKAKIGK